jgi:hypothetical protein
MEAVDFRIVPGWLRMRREGWGAERIVAHLGVALPPVDAVDIARRCDVAVTRHGDRRPLLGLTVTDERASLRVRNGERAADERLMVAYALGHLVVGPGDALLPEAALRAGGADDAAAAFARALLMPARLFVPYARAFSDEPPLLAEHFGVTVEAVERRLDELEAVTDGALALRRAAGPR